MSALSTPNHGISQLETVQNLKRTAESTAPHSQSSKNPRVYTKWSTDNICVYISLMCLGLVPCTYGHAHIEPNNTKVCAGAKLKQICKTSNLLSPGVPVGTCQSSASRLVCASSTRLVHHAALVCLTHTKQSRCIFWWLWIVLHVV